MVNRNSINVDEWLKIEDDKNNHKRKALENASTVFDDNDAFTVNTLEAIYGQESSFGKEKRKKRIDDPSGDFQLTKAVVARYKPPKKVSNNDSTNGHWITLDDGRHIFVGNKKFS